MIKSVDMFKYLIGVFCFACLIIIGSGCKSDANTAQKTKAPQKKVVKKQTNSRTPSPYWSAARKGIPLDEIQEKHIRAIQNKYKGEINKLKKQKKWNDAERTRIERQRAKEIEGKLGKELYIEYERFNTDWRKSIVPKQPVLTYWQQAKKDIPLKDKEIYQVKSIQNKYKTEINQLKKQKKWNADERARIERRRAREIKKLLGKKYDKYDNFNKSWQKKKN